jgi:hypothetical protein
MIFGYDFVSPDCSGKRAKPVFTACRFLQATEGSLKKALQA